MSWWKLVELGFRGTLRATEQLLPRPAEHLLGRMCMREIPHVQPKASVVADVHHFAKFVHVSGLAVGGQPHHFPFRVVHAKAQIRGDGAEQQSHRMGKANLFFKGDLGAAPHAPRRRGPFPDPVRSDDRGLLVRGNQKRAGRVGEVMLAVVDIFVGSELFLNRLADAQLVEQPDGHAPYPVAIGQRPAGQNRLQDTVEFDQRLFVEGDVIHVGDGDTRLRQAVIHRMLGKIAVVLDAIEALLFRGCDQLAVANQRRTGIMVIAGYAQDVHACVCLLPAGVCRAPVGT
jgi:hypothetical protein